MIHLTAMVFSLSSEFIENPENLLEQNHYEDFDERAKQAVFQLCKDNGWEYIIRFKEGSLRNVFKEFEVLSQYDNSVTTKECGSTLQTYRYVNEIDHEGYEINVVECKETEQKRIKRKQFLLAGKDGKSKIMAMN